MGRAYGRSVAAGVAEWLRGHPASGWQADLLDLARHGGMGATLPDVMSSVMGSVDEADGMICEAAPPPGGRMPGDAHVVWLAEYRGATPVVAPDDRAVARLAHEHLRSLGPARLAFAGLGGVTFSEVRADAFAAAAGTDVPRIETRDPDPSPITAALVRLARPLSIFAVNTMAARRVAAACRALGWAIPDDAAILGVDDDEVLCELNDPPLSAIDHNARGVGMAAAATLDAMFRGEGVPPLRRVPPVGVTRRRSTDVLAFDDADVRRAARFLRDRAVADDRVDVAAVVAHVGGGRRRIEQAFRREVGRGIHAEILRLRVAAAKRLLAGTPLAMPDVAARSGFGSATDLAKIFRRLEGTTPTAFLRAAT